MPYVCPAGKLTIGYGHVIKKGESFTRITKQRAEAILLTDMAIAESAVDRLVSVPLKSYQHAALVSFTFNLGSGNLARSTLLRKLNAGDYNGAANEFGRWVYSKGKILNGLVKRRKEEKEMFSGKC